jgi:hypothetical protein
LKDIIKRLLYTLNGLYDCRCHSFREKDIEFTRENRNSLFILEDLRIDGFRDKAAASLAYTKVR